MRNTDSHSRARRIIRQIEFRLDPHLVRSLFDEPIAEVTDRYECRAERPVTPASFLAIVSDFTRQVYGGP